MRSMENRCPVCFVPRRGGKRCGYHAEQRARGMSDDYIRESVAKTLECNQVIQIVCEAVDDARLSLKPESRQRPRRKPKPREVLTVRGYLIRELCNAVDIGRSTAGW